MNSDQNIFVNLTAMDILALNGAMGELGFPGIKGLNNLINTIQKGRPLGDMEERFYRNILRVCREYRPGDPRCDIGEFPGIMERTLEKVRHYTDMVNPEDPLQYHGKHLKLMDENQVYNYLADQTAASRRIIELFKVGRLELALPALKDQFVLVFEKMYKGIYEQIKDLFQGLIVGEDEPHHLAEDILALEKVYRSGKRFRSDLRCIRNAFAHPDRVDRYDHYSIRVFGKETMDFDAEGLEKITALMGMKLSLLMFLIRIAVEFRLYRIIFENRTT